MIAIEKEYIKNIPVLHMGKQEVFGEKLPLIIFIHGFMSAKEHNLHYAYLLAEKGFRVVLPEAAGHGERGTGLSERQMMPRFWEIVVQTISELNEVKEDLTSRGLVDQERIGVAGTSMGGIITNGALAAYDWISAAVSLMGNPAYVSFAEYQIDAIKQAGFNLDLSDEQAAKQIAGLRPFDLTLNKEKLAGRPLLFWHGAKDATVPYDFAYRFYQNIKPSYRDEDKISFILDKKADHKVSRKGVLAAVSWFDQHLNRPAMQNI
ncbi:alpha/beta fold hydrolase [Bacillus massiliglaciei]|uniref:alpha/beta fold hydrolase n=1 Tax=Bacillus massiliglaciei TaxID=1816693 RepID=UPI000A99DEAE|nr:alpha/beta fold hydrolase [Bacillus massiliglaciei]